MYFTLIIYYTKNTYVNKNVFYVYFFIYFLFAMLYI
nr:MAG TPA: hypothetical protein [Caudoviricetes sp.]